MDDIISLSAIEGGFVETLNGRKVMMKESTEVMAKDSRLER